MINGIGIDIVDLTRIQTIVEKNDSFIKRVLTQKELALFEKLSHKRKIEFLGGRFACKEAFSKAYGTGIGKIQLRDIEILKETNGRPVITMSPFKGHTHVSISHTDTLAIAQVILEE